MFRPMAKWGKVPAGEDAGGEDCFLTKMKRRKMTMKMKRSKREKRRKREVAVDRSISMKFCYC